MQSLGGGETGKGQGYHRDLHPDLGKPLLSPGVTHKETGNRYQHYRHRYTDTDFLGDQGEGQLGTLIPPGGSRCQRQEHEQDRHRQTVIEAALHVQAFPNPRRHRRVCDHPLAQRSVGRRQHGGQHTEFEDGNPGEYQATQPDTQGYTQWQADQQHTARQNRMGTQGLEIGVGGIDEQHQRQGQVGNDPQLDRRNIEFDKPQSYRPCEQAEKDENHWTGHGAALHPPGNGAEQKAEYRQNHQIVIHD